jgi:hypothetical protein
MHRQIDKDLRIDFGVAWFAPGAAEDSLNLLRKARRGSLSILSAA